MLYTAVARNALYAAVLVRRIRSLVCLSVDLPPVVNNARTPDLKQKDV